MVMRAHVRPAREADAAKLARIQIESWRDTYPSLVSAHYLVEHLRPERAEARFRRALTLPRNRDHLLVALDASDQVCGYVSAGPARDGSFGFDGEVYELYLAIDARGQGHGRALLAAVANELIAARRRSAMVEVLAGNPARWFYEAMGARAAALHDHHFAGEALPALVYGWQDLEPLARRAT